MGGERAQEMKQYWQSPWNRECELISDLFLFPLGFTFPRNFLASPWSFVWLNSSWCAISKPGVKKFLLYDSSCSFTLYQLDNRNAQWLWKSCVEDGYFGNRALKMVVEDIAGTHYIQFLLLHIHRKLFPRVPFPVVVKVILVTSRLKNLITSDFPPLHWPKRLHV